MKSEPKLAPWSSGKVQDTLKQKWVSEGYAVGDLERLTKVISKVWTIFRFRYGRIVRKWLKKPPGSCSPGRSTFNTKGGLLLNPRVVEAPNC